MKAGILQQLIFLAGLAQVALVVGSLFVPKVLGWKSELTKLRPLIKQMFWTYAAYILVINLCFGLLSMLDTTELINGTHLSTLITGFIAAYWITRVLIQFLYFDRNDFPRGIWPAIGEVILVIAFVFLSAIYTIACYHNLQPVS